MIICVEWKTPQDTNNSTLHRLTSPRHPWTPQNTFTHPINIPLSPRNGLHHSQELARHSERLLCGPGLSEGTLGKKRLPYMISVERQGCLFPGLPSHIGRIDLIWSQYIVQSTCGGCMNGGCGRHRSALRAASSETFLLHCYISGGWSDEEGGW